MQYASMSRELLRGENFLHLFDNGKAYLDKPPMIFWMTALFFKIIGVSEFVFRIPSIIFSLFPIYSTFQLSLLFYSKNVAKIAALILASCETFYIINADILIMGYTFKENCADTRNTKVKDIIYQLIKNKINIEIYDPYVENNNDFNFIQNPFLNEKKYDCIMATVSHDQFKKYKVDDFIKISKGKLVLLDIKGMYNFSTWKL